MTSERGRRGGKLGLGFDRRSMRIRMVWNPSVHVGRREPAGVDRLVPAETKWRQRGWILGRACTQRWVLAIFCMGLRPDCSSLGQFPGVLGCTVHRGRPDFVIQISFQIFK
jgi:hypothetical protein